MKTGQLFSLWASSLLWKRSLLQQMMWAWVCLYKLTLSVMGHFAEVTGPAQA